MIGLTDREQDMMNQLKKRLGQLKSPVVRSQLLMQFSQLVDMAYLGDTSSERESELVRRIDELGQKLGELQNPEEWT